MGSKGLRRACSVAGTITVFLGLALPSCAQGHAGPGVGENAPAQVAAARPVVATALAAAADEPAPAPVAAPRRFGTCDPSSRGPHKLTIAYINDLQARYSDRIDGYSRYAYIAGYLRALKAEVPETIVLDAGDDYEKGSIAELRSMGESTRQMIQALPIDARTVGNHDFAYGAGAILRDVERSAHPVLGANITSVNGGSPFASFVRVDVGCVKVGITGMVTQNYGADDLPTRDAFDGILRQHDNYAEVLASVVAEHRAEVDVMIALDHLGLYEDTLLAMREKGVDLVVGGHSEDLVKGALPVFRADGSRAWIVQAGHYGQAIGRLELSFSPDDKKVGVVHAQLVTVDAHLPMDMEVASLAARLEREYAPDTHQTIGVVKSVIPVGKMPELIWHAARDRWQVDAILVGRDLYWDALPAGPITLQRLYDSLLVQREPAGTSGFTSLHVMEVVGSDLLELKKKALAGPKFHVVTPDVIDKDRTYRMVIEKRALTYPLLAFRGQTTLPKAGYAGEMIDLVESYARARTERGLQIE